MVRTEFKCAELKAKWEHLCSRVLEECAIPPAYRIVCYFDDESVCVEPSERGLFVPDIGKSANRVCWPVYVKKYLSDDAGFLDALIYVPGYACCADDEGLFVMALAHELRHLVQWAAAAEVFSNNKKIERLRPTVLARKWDLPIERDAMISSKRVAAAIRGLDVVNGWAWTRINSGDSQSMPFWEFFQSISPYEHYDWVGETNFLIDRCFSSPRQ